MRSTARRSRIPPLLLALVFVYGAAGAAGISRTRGPLAGYLPGDQEAAGWVRDGEAQEFEGEALYTYIDGGAEIYEEYGFRRVIVQDYRSSGGTSVSLEIFEMETPAAAYGMFTFKRSGQGQSLDLGGGGELEAYYLNFWKGRFLATLTGFDETAGTVEGLLALAKAVDSKIKDRGMAPELVGLLPPQGLVVGTVKYLKGLLGLNNVYSFYTARGLDFSEAVKADYGDGSTVIVLRYGTKEAFDPAFPELWKALDESGRFAKADEERILRDGKGRFLSFSARPPAVIVGLGPDAETARRRMESAVLVSR
jgi:hypothetical protein